MNAHTISKLDSANNILLLGPTREERTNETCRDLLIDDLLTEREGTQLNVLNVTFDQTPADRLHFWDTYVDEELPANAAILTMNDVGEPRSGTDESLRSAVDIRPIADSADTMTLALEMIQCLSKWTANDNQSVGCVYTLSDLLRRSGRESTIELLTRVFERSTQLNARVHYHLDPAEHDDATLQLLEPLFDAVVDVSGEGTPRVERFDSVEVRDLGGTSRSDAHTATSDQGTTRSNAQETTRSDARGTTRSGTQRTTRSNAQESTFDTDHILTLLADLRRRQLLYQLERQEPGAAIDFDELVERITDAEDGRRTDRQDLRRRIAIDLRHQHLPKLEEAGVLQYDFEIGIVRQPWNSTFATWVKHVHRVDDLLMREL